MNSGIQNNRESESHELVPQIDSPPTSRCVDWYAEGQSRTVEVHGIRVTIRFIGRKGRRGRIEIEAPSGAVFDTLPPRTV